MQRFFRVASIRKAQACLRNTGSAVRWPHCDLNPVPSACEAFAMSLHHAPVIVAKICQNVIPHGIMGGVSACFNYCLSLLPCATLLLASNTSPRRCSGIIPPPHACEPGSTPSVRIAWRNTAEIHRMPEAIKSREC